MPDLNRKIQITFTSIRILQIVVFLCWRSIHVWKKIEFYQRQLLSQDYIWCYRGLFKTFNLRCFIGFWLHPCAIKCKKLRLKQQEGVCTFNNVPSFKFLRTHEICPDHHLKNKILHINETTHRKKILRTKKNFKFRISAIAEHINPTTLSWGLFILIKNLGLLTKTQRQCKTCYNVLKRAKPD